MLKVGLTGGIASGKSFVLGALAEMGCHTLQADELGHAVLRSTGEAYAETVREFGTEILDADGEIDRRRLAAVVFDRPERLEALNGIVHPAVFRLQQQLLDDVARADPGGIAVIEAAIMIETGNYRRFDRIILVVVDENEQIKRAAGRGGTREEAQRRLSRQMPFEEKKKFADYIIDTSGTKEETLRKTREVYESLRRIVL